MAEPFLSDLSGCNNLYAAFALSAEAMPEAVALKGDGGRGQTFTYAELHLLVRQLATGLQAAEFASEPEIGLVSENRPEWPLIYLAVVASGKTIVPLDANLKAGEIIALIEQAGLTTVFASSSFVDQLQPLSEKVKIISLEDTSSDAWRSYLGEADNFKPAGSRQSPAALIYTSGTTGQPKAVVLTHHNLLTNLAGIRSALQFGPDDVFLSVLPLHHTFETTCGFLTPLVSGSAIVYARSLKSNEIVEDIKANQVSIVCGVPLLWEKMYHSFQRKLRAAPLLRKIMFHLFFRLVAWGRILSLSWRRPLFASLRTKAGLSSIRLFVSGAAALPPHIARFFNLIGFDLIEGYGMTEASPVISANRPDDILFGSVGPPLDGVEVKINAPDKTGIGEILARGGNVTPGYKNDPEKNEALLAGGWLHTGDLGKMERGHLWITGRAKNLIVSAAGKNIYPEEIEAKLNACDLILESLVYGRKKTGRQGEEVCALIVPDLEMFNTELGHDPGAPDRSLVAQEIKKLVAEANREMAEFKRLSSYELRYEELEKTSTKKIKRFVYAALGDDQ